MRKLILMGSLLVAPMAANANLIVNGDFELGDTGFSSDYIKVGTGAFPTPPGVPASSAGAAGSENMFNEGTYTVTNAQPGAWHALWRNDVDLANHGWYLLVNGFTAGGNHMWHQNIAGLTAGQDYRLEFDLVSVFAQDTSPAHIHLTLGGVDIISVDAPTGTEQWKHVFGDFHYTGPSTEAALLDVNTTAVGNDFGIDNISLTPVPEPATIGITALGLASLFAKKRTRKS